MGIVATDMRRAFVSTRFIISILLVACVRLFSGGNIRIMEDVVQTYVYGNDLDELVFILCGIPFINGFIEDWNGRSFLPFVSRCGICKYAMSKFFVAIISAVVCSFLGNALYVAVMMYNGPLMIQGGSNHDVLSFYFMGGTLVKDQPLLFLLGRWLSFAFVQTIVMAAAVFFSSYSLKPLMALISPMVIYFLMSFLVWMAGAPYYLLPANQIKGNMRNNDLLDLGLYVCECGIVLTVLARAYINRLKELMRRA